MSDVIRQETTVFLLAVLHGIGLTVLYDVLRILRRVIRHSLPAVSVEDLLFWITAGFLTFCFAFRQTEGIIRGYVAVGIAIGSILYHCICSDFLVRSVSLCLKVLLGTVIKPWKEIIVFLRKKGYNTVWAFGVKAGGEHYRTRDIKGVRQNGETQKTGKQE